MTLRDKLHSCEIRRALNVEPLLRIEKSQLCWFSQVFRMPHERLARQVLLAKLMGKWPGDCPRIRWSVGMAFRNTAFKLYTRDVKLIFTEGHISIMVALKGPVITKLTTIIYTTLMIKEHLCDVIMVMLQWNETSNWITFLKRDKVITWTSFAFVSRFQKKQAEA